MQGIEMGLLWGFSVAPPYPLFNWDPPPQPREMPLLLTSVQTNHLVPVQQPPSTNLTSVLPSHPKECQSTTDILPLLPVIIKTLKPKELTRSIVEHPKTSAVAIPVPLPMMPDAPYTSRFGRVSMTIWYRPYVHNNAHILEVVYDDWQSINMCFHKKCGFQLLI